jgi:2-polyprenyl-3-methyl-5-hydroxy-6-metoxy-1,4-benzoquinol methylase
MPNPVSQRLTVSTPELDAEELAWWQRFAACEQKFAWVQTPEIQSFLRGKYIRRIIRAASDDGRILDMGCGDGWLSVLLVEHGARSVVGVDFSAAQIELAQKSANEQGVSDRVSFRVTDASAGATAEKYDVVVAHAFLHHLTVSEIESALDAARGMVRDGGRLILLEPILYPLAKRTIFQRAISGLLFRLARNAGFVQGFGPLNRRPGEKELQMRRLLAERPLGRPPRGPSPKEMPFEPDDLEKLLKGRFTVIDRTPCLIASHLVAQESLLMELSSPKAARMLRWPLLWLARTLERILLASKPLPGNFWIFEMFICQ